VSKVTSTVTSKGQITNPKAFRDRLGLSAGDQVTFTVDDGGTVAVSPSAASPLGRTPALLRHLARSRVVTVEEMKAAIARHVRRTDRSSP